MWHSALKGGVRNFFHDRVEQALISHLYGSCDLRSTLCQSNLSILGPPEPKNCPKWPKSLRNDAKSGFDSSGGPKRLDRLGSWLDLFMGRPTQPIGSNFGIRGVPNFGRFWPILARFWPIDQLYEAPYFLYDLESKLKKL